MDAPFAHVLTTVEELRTHYREPSRLVQRKKVEHLDDVTRSFIAASPFVLLATASVDGTCDVSPRGGPPGFVRVLDDRRLALPDLSGNNLLDSLINLASNAHVGLLFLIPGRDETLRVDGRAWVTTDPELLGRWDDELARPKTAIGVEVQLDELRTFGGQAQELVKHNRPERRLLQPVEPSLLKATKRRWFFDSLRMLSMTRPSVNSAMTVSFGLIHSGVLGAATSPRCQVLP
jgi:PPOX class probable FMN-dependent enzyme